MSAAQDNGHDPGGADALEGLLRVVAGVWLRTAVWGVETSVRVGTAMARAAVSRDAAAELVGDVRSGLRGYARELLGISDLDERVRQLMPPAAHAPGEPRPMLRSLRAQGAELLRQSADVDAEDDVHPAYARILTELAPRRGADPAVARARGPAARRRRPRQQPDRRRLSARGPRPEHDRGGGRVPILRPRPGYLNNLNRLGLIWFSHDPVAEPARYQVIEAQPDTMAAIKRAGRAKTIHRSVHLTPFGKDFCDVCLPLDTAELQEPS